MTASELLAQYRKRPADLTPGKDAILMEIVAAAMVEQAAALERQSELLVRIMASHERQCAILEYWSGTGFGGQLPV